MSVTKLGISHGYTNGHFTQMFWKSIRKINSACNEAVTELEELRKENDVLKQRNYILENELLSSKSLRKLENVLGKEQSLCKNAIRLMNTPITDLPLPIRVINVLKNTEITTFGELPLLSLNDLQAVRNCGRKTIVEIQGYLENFSLRLDMTYDEVIKKLAKLSDEDIPTEEP